MAELQTYKGFYLWHYLPSRAAAAIFLLLFLAATAFHVWKIWKLKTWFCICFAIGGICKFNLISTRAAWLTVDTSRVYRLLRQSLRLRQDREDHAILHPKYLHPTWSCSLRRLGLHGSGPNHHRRRRGAPLADPRQLAHQDLCPRRCPVLRGSRRRRWYDGR